MELSAYETLEKFSSEELQRQFRDRFPADDRAYEFLSQLPPDVKSKIITTFDPKNRDRDYSRQLTAYINSFLRGDGDGAVVAPSAQSRKRKRDEIEVLEDELEAFRARYPMDDRAWEFLTTSPSEACARVLREFRPRTQGDADYSSLVTTLVKRARLDCQLADTDGPSLPPRRGPAMKHLQRFRGKFPMDDRAWEFLCAACGETQEKVVTEFRPRREDDDDYSAAITAFVRSLEKTASVSKGPNQVQLLEFRNRFPTDDRAFEFLITSSAEVQVEVLARFSPTNMDETDFSRQLTSYVRKVREVARDLNVPAEADEELVPFAAAAELVARPPLRGGPGSASFRRGVSNHRSRMDAFRKRYPMDDRAFDFLQGLARDLQETVISEFQPRREGDPDYSAAVTSFTRAVRDRRDPLGITASGGGTGSGRKQRESEQGRRSSRQPSALQAFLRRYPMDERALDFLQQAPSEVQEAMLEEFRPRREGDEDYSGAVTSFLRKLLDRHGSEVGGRRGGVSRRLRSASRGRGGGNLDPLKLFRKKYPMDDRAWEFLSSSSAGVQRRVIADFRPRSEGDEDYSGLVTSFIRTVRTRMEQDR